MPEPATDARSETGRTGEYDEDHQRELATFIRTLVGAGLTVTTAITKPNCLVVSATRSDEFGLPSNYVFAYGTAGSFSSAHCATLAKVAKESRAALVIAGEASAPPKSGVVITKDDLLAKLGGPVLSLLPLEPDYAAQLVALGSSKLPSGLTGRADDLFEAYVHAGLQFLVRGRVLRYGQKRRFEALPDGLAFDNAPLMLYDCKAAESEYSITKESIRQFGDYIRDFRKRYGKYLGQPHAFLLISSTFQSDKHITGKSNELYADCHVPLVCMTAQTLAECVEIFADRPRYRMAIDWARIFVPPTVDTAAVRKQVEAREKDRIMR